MPSKNIIKEFTPESYYHIYNRGVEARKIFLDNQDYTVFLGLLKKYLTGESGGLKNQNRHVFKNFHSELKLLAYCLMPNHFHLLFYQIPEAAVSQFMRRVTTGYVMYFNDRYQRRGGLFEGIYKASQINADAYLHHISRYIHLNPDKYESWPYSSFPVYIGKKKTQWVDTRPILELFNSPQEYKEFVADYEDSRAELRVLKHQLANADEA